MPLKVKKNPENPESPEVLASAIIKIADSFKKLLGEQFTEEGIVSLLHAMPGNDVGKPQIRLVLSNLKSLKGYYLRKEAK